MKHEGTINGFASGSSEMEVSSDWWDEFSKKINGIFFLITLNKQNRTKIIGLLSLFIFVSSVFFLYIFMICSYHSANQS